jgi:DNA polymerase-3 subunit alpha (Gram-positive type)
MDKLLKLLKEINLDEEYYNYFKEGNIDQVVVYDHNKCFDFVIKVTTNLPLEVYLTTLTKLKNKFSQVDNIELTIEPRTMDNSKLNSYLNFFIDSLSGKYQIFKDRTYTIKDNVIHYPVFNQIEMSNLKVIENDLLTSLKKFGYNLTISLEVEKSKEEELQKEIEKEKIVTATTATNTKTTSSETKKVEPSPNKNYRQKRSQEITAIKDIIYEVENINIEAKIFGIDIFESAKSGFKIFTLKVTDYTDSMYAKIFTKDEDEFARLKDLLKTDKWYQFYGKASDDKYAGEIVFTTRFKDITPIDSKEETIREDTAEEKRVELHAHTMMSQMDGVIDEIKLVKQAIKWGHPAIAITDHDGCQAFPHVFNEVTKYNKGLEAPYKSRIKELEEQIKETTNAEEITTLTSELNKVKEDKKNLKKFKALYGVELEMSDGNLDIVVNPTDKTIEDATYVIFDTETTGFNAGLNDSMIEIGAVKMKDGAIIENFDELINPGHSIDSEITKLTGITDDMVANCPNEEEVTKRFKEWIGDLPLVAQNAKFDRSMLEMAYHKYNLGSLDNTILDTMVISQIINKDLKRHSLTALTKNYGITFEENDGDETTEKHHHRADYDAEFTGYVFFKMVRQLTNLGINTFNDLSKLPTELEVNKWCRECHVNIIAKNRAGLKNMFKLISFASTKYLVKAARIPKNIISEYRDNIIVGSGCYNSEIFKAALTQTEDKLKEIMSFYDYIEIQPPSNYSHLIARHDINNPNEVLVALKKIIKCAKEIDKLVVATSDAHTLNKEDKIYREIIVNQNIPGKGRHPLARYLNTKGYDTIPDQYLRTTNEMLEEFSFLDKDLAKEIVITNPNKIADMCDIIEVIIDTGGIPFSPKIDKSVETVIDLVYTKAQSWYGNPLPTDIEERIAKELYGDSVLASINDNLKREGKLEGEELKKEAFKRLHDTIVSGDDKVKELVRENIRVNSEIPLTDEELDKQLTKNLGGIIGGGFDVIYLIAQKLVKHSNDDGFLVGSRGSVGSSFVATMMGITEVNPLAAHYRCPKCKLSIFNDEEGNALGATYSSGFDLPDKKCPNCNIPFIKDGQDMPFATFLGFNADKVPDIDLNFSDLNQASAHDYTKVLFGVDNVYRAGTIGTVAEKTAFGYVKGFCEDRGITMRTAEIERLAEGCTGVKRTTGQHPGGIVVIPGYMDVYDFTPYQYPADDPTSAWRTTHFDYHAIDQDVLKLDILGHTDPTQLRMIQDITGKDVREVPLDDKPTMAIFLSPEPLGVTKEQIMCETGTLGIPEFGTPFTIGMLVDTKPKTFAELIKISGLSHGTDVWLGNAQDLIRSGTVEFKNVIGCRDDIMVYLMYHGLEPIKAFKIMEFVRKGKASKEPDTWAKHKETMEKAGIEPWFIDSCQKIKYMFPKAHAAAYVISAFRIAYYKVHHPEIYYATYFSTRFDDFDIEVMIRGYNAIKEKMIEINNKGYDASNKESSILETLKLSLEATARGIKFGHLDIMKSDAKNFVIDEDNITLIPPFRTIDGLGETVAQNIREEAQKAPFISVEDFQKRCKVSQTLIDKMRAMGLFQNMPESSQLSLF